MFTDKTFVIIMAFTNGEIGLAHPPEGQDPEVTYHRACEDNAGNGNIKTLALAQVLKLNYPSAIAKCRVIRSYTERGKLHWEISCSVCDHESVITPKEGWMVQNPGAGLVKHCSNCGVKFTGWGIKCPA